MNIAKTMPEYVEKLTHFRDEVLALREILLRLPLEEGVKWGGPVYMVDGKNVIGVGSFKAYFGLWFFQGALLKDEDKVLINAGGEKTAAMRQWRFRSWEELDKDKVVAYVLEAIENQKAGKVIAPKQNKPIVIDPVMMAFFESEPEYHAKFEALSKTHKREMASYIVDAKRPETKQNRLEKVKKHLEMGTGLYDRYK